MKISVVIFLSMIASIHSNSAQNIPQSKEVTQRRESITYSNSIIHENPNYQDQAAQSAVNVNFHSNQIDPLKQLYGHTPYQKPEYPQVYTQSYPTNTPQSQLFNVGYSVRFTNNNNNKPPKPKYTRNNNLDDGEIITGTRKQNEEVQIPVNMSPQEFVSTALINQKKQKISGIKPKPQIFTNYQNPKLLLSQANLSPATQKYYKTLEQLKPQVQNTQELQQKYSWRSLGPGVEIIKSTEVPTPQKYTRTENPISFDHAKALGRSQDFDYSNALEKNNQQQQQQHQQQNAFYYNNVNKVQPFQHLQISQISAVPKQNLAKLPLDTTLLREQIPIHLDTRYIEEAINKQINYINNKYLQTQEQPIQKINSLQQPYRTIVLEESSQTRPVQVFYQQEQPKNYQEYQIEHNRFPFKIYGKPQPLPLNLNDASSEEQQKRQPRYLADLNTNLRPPPFHVQYQRRIRVG